MNLNTSRFNGLSTLLANPAHLAALRKFSTDTTATAADYGLTAKDLSYLGSACECALIDLGDLLETFARMHMDWQGGHQDTDPEAVARAVRLAESKGVDLADLPLAELQNFSNLIADDVYQVLTPEGSLKARNHIGGTAPEQVRHQIERWRKLLA